MKKEKITEQIIEQITKKTETYFYDYFENKELLELALTHKSYSSDNRSTSRSKLKLKKDKDSKVEKKNNEKLEFLGDALLDFIIAEYLMELYPNDEEGSLSKKRASLVNVDTLAQVARNLNLERFLRLGKSEVLAHGENNPRLLASAYEALLGALYQDRGLKVASSFVRNHFMDLVHAQNTQGDFTKDYKTRLQEVAHRLIKKNPSYLHLEEVGRDHERKFHVSVQIEGFTWIAEAWGKSKKHAEQEAARLALEVYLPQEKLLYITGKKEKTLKSESDPENEIDPETEIASETEVNSEKLINSEKETEKVKEKDKEGSKNENRRK